MIGCVRRESEDDMQIKERENMQVDEPTKRGIFAKSKSQEGAIGWILLWLLGIPIPILIILFLVRGCT